MSTPSTDAAARFRRVADGMTRTIEAVPRDAWGSPSPCEGWTALDVVRHLVEWVPGPGFLLGAFDVDAGPIPSVDEDPAGAWAVVRDAVQGALDDPAVAGRVRDCGPPGRMSLEAAIEMTCTPDVLIHTWDLAQATGVEVVLDPEAIARQATGIDEIPPEVDDAMRGSGHFGPRVVVGEGADPTTRVLAFFGRRG